MTRLDNTDAILQSISEQHGTSLNGRLKDLRPEPIPDDIKIQQVPSESVPESIKEKEEAKEEEKEDGGSSASESQGLKSV